jgi:hypothetical protein
MYSCWLSAKIRSHFIFFRISWSYDSEIFLLNLRLHGARNVKASKKNLVSLHEIAVAWLFLEIKGKQLATQWKPQWKRLPFKQLVS